MHSTAADAEAEKAKGNALFGAGDFVGAVSHYSAALDMLQRVSPIPEDGASSWGQARALKGVLLANRAMAHLKTGDCQEALDDCTKALSFNPANGKAYYRRGMAFSHMGRWSEARYDFVEALNFEKLGVVGRDSADAKTSPAVAACERELTRVELELSAERSRNSTPAKACELVTASHYIPAIEAARSAPMAVTEPRNFYELELQWRKYDSPGLERFRFDLLRAADPSKFRSLFKLCLDGDFLSSVISTVTQLARSEDASDEFYRDAINILRGLTRVQRFDFCVDLLSRSEVSELEQTICTLEKCSNSVALEEIRLKYLGAPDKS